MTLSMRPTDRPMDLSEEADGCCVYYWTHNELLCYLFESEDRWLAIYCEGQTGGGGYALTILSSTLSVPSSGSLWLD
jgi:hypothetical protein